MITLGIGNINGNWSIGIDHGIELALRAKNRQTGTLLDGSTGTYFADPGTYTGGGVKAKWNYGFSVNPGTLAGLTFKLGVDHDPTAGVNYSWVNPQTYWFDNATSGNGFQNSQNVGFGGTPGGAFNVNTEGLYNFVLQAFDGTTLVDSTSMNVQVGITVPVPEPETYALMLAGLGLMGVAVRRRTRP